MERVTGIGGLFVRAHAPERLSSWYAEQLGVDPPPESYDTPSWWQQPGPTVVAAMGSDSEHFGGPDRTWSVNFRVTDLDAMVRQLRDAGNMVEVDPETYPNGRFATLRDPERNVIQLWEPAGVDLSPPRTPGMDTPLALEPVAWVESPLVDAEHAPLQGDEGSPDAWLVFEERVGAAMADLRPGTDVLVLTWLDRACRDVLAVHPRGDRSRPVTGVFSTRSQDRPNPIGLHRVGILAIDGLRVAVRGLEAFDRTPVLDVKPVLERPGER